MTQESATGNAWTVLAGTSGEFGQVVLFRSVTVDGFDIPCAKFATFFGVSVVLQNQPGCVAKPIVPAPKPPELITKLALHADQGDESTAKIVHELMWFLWWDPRNRYMDEVMGGNDRLTAMVLEVARVRLEYSIEVRPGWTRSRSEWALVADTHQFSKENMKFIHNQYKDSLTWMRADIRTKYDQILDEGKNPQRFSKDCFNVHFKKAWGSKAFFMHLVRFGVKGDISAMLHTFVEFKETDEYQKIVSANAEKSATERAMKLVQLWIRLYFF
jgi:hypothetical protein